MHENALSKNVVDIFIIDEVQELVYDNKVLDEWKETCLELGLEKQEALAKPDKSPIPFLVMSQTLNDAIKELCPVSVEIEDYSQGPIPIEILRNVKLGKNEGYFQKVEILYDDKDLDPACIGIVGYWHGYDTTNSGWEGIEQDGTQVRTSTKKELEQIVKKLGIEKVSYHFSENVRYLIGRWADVRLTIDEIKKKGVWENFGQKEYLKLKEKWDRYIGKFSSETDRRIQEELDGLFDWCVNRDNNNLDE